MVVNNRICHLKHISSELDPETQLFIPAQAHRNAIRPKITKTKMALPLSKALL